MYTRFLSFLNFQLRWQLRRKRWLLPIPLLLFLAYRSINYLTMSGAGGAMQATNIWDLLFLVFGNRWTVYFLGLLYLYLVCDLLPEPGLGQLVLIRLRSRKAWWIGKMLTLLILTLFYIVISVLILAACGMAVLPWEAGYSSQARFIPESVNLPMQFFRGIQPPLPWGFLAQELALLLLGLFTFGMVMMVVNQVTRRFYFGLLAGCLVLFAGLVSISLSGPPVWAAWLPGPHLTYFGTIPIRTIPLENSFLYWAAWIVIFGLVGLAISRRQDHRGSLD
jgi:hypothetical protein